MLVESMGLENEVNCIVKSIYIEQSPITHIATPLTLPDIVVTQIAPSSIVASSAPQLASVFPSLTLWQTFVIGWQRS